MRRFNPVLLALVGLVVLLLLVWLLTGLRSSDQDKLSGNEVAATKAGGDPEKRCASQATYDMVKRELFRRAAQVRGSDQAAYDRLSGYAALRVENPVMESQDKDTGAINCSGSFSIDLPPGVAVAGGRRSLTSDVDYTIQKAADGSGDVVLLRNADAIITPLATLSRTGTPPVAAGQAPTAQPDQTSAAPAQPQLPAAVAPPRPVAPTPPAPPQPAQARPAFDCSGARSSGERAVCSDPGLAALDRSMSAQYSRALSQADPDERALLVQTGRRFIRYRDNCPSRACIGDAYNGRMREIRDIMQGNWQPPQ